MLRANRDEHRAVAESRIAVALRLVLNANAILAGKNGSDIHAFQKILAAHTLAATPETNAAVLNAAYQHQPLLKDINTNAAVLNAAYQHQPLLKDINTTTAICCVVFSPDGHRVVSGSVDKTVRVWDVDTGTEIGPPLTGNTDGVRSVASSPDGQRVVSGGDDGIVRVWDAPTRETVATAIEKLCAKLAYNMSTHQWAGEIPPDIASYSPSCPGLPAAPNDSE
jgi:WD40 repeat protein